MLKALDSSLAPILFIPHGGGPLPLLGDASHQSMRDFLSTITPELGQPDAILVISAHWEAPCATITSGASPELIYDYYGFAQESYSIRYPAPGHPELALNISRLLGEAGIEARLDTQRGFDHGLFVPLKLMYPAAGIPCVQLSLLSSLDPGAHIALGTALASLRHHNILILGSGFSFHNLPALFAADKGEADPRNDAFEQWLFETCTAEHLSEEQRAQRLIQWHTAPAAEYCHPREEHLLPLHVCYGMAQSAAQRVFDGSVAGKHASAYLW